MTTYKFKIEEVNRDGFIAWDAVEKSTGKSIVLNTSGKYIVGSYPEIAKYLSDTYNINIDLTYNQAMFDKFDQSEQTWIFVRGEINIVVEDIIRTLFRFTF